MNYLKEIFRKVKQESPALYWIVIIHFFLSLICLVGIMVDDRILAGINVWIKPFKFALSGGIYILTVGYLIQLYPFSVKKKKIINGTVAWTMLIEIIIIVAQAARGVGSHYNDSLPLDGMLFLAMGVLIGVNVLIMILFIIETLRLKLNTEKSVQWAILMGWLVIFFGSWIGGQMISQGAHNVGVIDGGEGLPLLNWSTIAGDLRVAHFFGLHGIQIIPLFSFLLLKKWNTNMKNQIIVVNIFGLLYAGWIAFTFYQAKQGMPLIHL